MRDGVVGYVPIHISAYSLLSSSLNLPPGVEAANFAAKDSLPCRPQG